MNDKFDPKSINTFLGRIDQKVTDMDEKIDGLVIGQEKLWRAHSNLRVKVAGYSVSAGLLTAVVFAWVKAKITGDPK